MNPPAQCDPAAFYDVLQLAAIAVLAGESGEAVRKETSLLEASIAAVDAFPAGTPEADALGVILAAAGRVSAEVTP